jgi:glutaredoxin
VTGKEAVTVSGPRSPVSASLYALGYSLRCLLSVSAVKPMWQLTLYTREGCGLCEEMKGVIHKVGEEVPLELEEVDVDGTPDLKQKFGYEVPVLFINGRKAFKYRLTGTDLRKKLR